VVRNSDTGNPWQEFVDCRSSCQEEFPALSDRSSRWAKQSIWYCADELTSSKGA
jgi:hypothetical protein